MSRRDAAVRGGHELAPVFTLPAQRLDTVGPPVHPAGVVLGADRRGGPVTVTLSRAAPTRLVLLGGLYLARQVVLRAVAAGTRALVCTGRPSSWEPVRHAASTDQGEPPVVVRQDLPRDAPRDAPLLVVHDRGATTRGPDAARVPWRTTMVVLPTLVPAVADLADDADLVLIQRMPPHEAELAGRLWALSPTMTETLRTLPDHAVVLLGRNLWCRVDLVTGPRETAILGPVRRGD